MINKNTQYTDKKFFTNRVTKVSDTSIKSTLSNFITTILTAIRVKHS